MGQKKKGKKKKTNFGLAVLHINRGFCVEETLKTEENTYIC